MARQESIDVPKMVCRGKCGKSLSIATNFYAVTSPIHENTGYRIPICKKCISDIYDYYYSIYQDDYKCVERMCMMFDIIYDENTLDIALRSGTSNPFGQYISKLNLLKVDDKTYNPNFDKLTEYKEIYGKYENSSDFVEDNQLDEELVKKWGKGFETEDYENLENHYKMLKSTNPNCNENQEIFIRDLCFTKMQQINAIKKGDTTAFKDLTKLYSDTFKQAGLRMTYDESANSEDCFGVLLERISQYTPEEFYKDKTLFDDFDSIKDYFKRFVLRPLKNLQHNQNERDYEFCVKEESE